MSEPVHVVAGGGETVGDTPDRRVEIVSDDERLHATWSRLGPFREGADPHVHHRHTDLFYVLEGELMLMLGAAGEERTLPAGTLACMPPFVIHGFRNASDAEVRYLNFHAPGERFADFLRALRDGREFSYDQHAPPADGGRPPSEAAIGVVESVTAGPRYRVSVLADAEAIGIAEVASEGEGLPPPLHLHRRHVESFYVLAGELTFIAGEHELRVGAGSWLQIPAGVPHAFAFPQDGPVRFLDVHTPSCGFGAFVRRLHAADSDEERAAARAGFDQEPA